MTFTKQSPAQVILNRDETTRLLEEGIQDINIVNIELKKIFGDLVILQNKLKNLDEKIKIKKENDNENQT